MNITYLVGTTGTGKTKLSSLLAQKNRSTVVISADSRQVYQGMDIVTGKDHPKELKIHGIDLVQPDQNCSVSLWFDSVTPLLKRAQEAGRAVIVVGGTGFYVRALTHGIATLSVPPNPALRSSLEKLSLTHLRTKLQKLDPVKWASLNHSDQNNPRRLIRAIEVARAPSPPTPPRPALSRAPLVGLYYSDLELQTAVIRERVTSRLKQGAVAETQSLLQKYPHDLQSFSALGYSQIRAYLHGELTEPQLIASWVSAELKYAKRQLTFFRKQNVTWYDRGRISIEEIYEHLSS